MIVRSNITRLYFDVSILNFYIFLWVDVPIIPVTIPTSERLYTRPKQERET